MYIVRANTWLHTWSRSNGDRCNAQCFILESRSQLLLLLFFSLFLITNLMLEGQHSDPAAGWIECKAELPGGDTNRRGEMCWYRTDTHYKLIKNKENKCDPTLKKKNVSFFWPGVLSDIRHPMKSTDKRCRAEYISGSFKSSVGVLLFFFQALRRKGSHDEKDRDRQ